MTEKKPDSLADMMCGKKPEKLPPVIADRSKLENIAGCPHQDYLVEKHKIDPSVREIEVNGKLVVVGSILHELIDEAVKACAGELDGVADYFLSELPTTRPDVQSECIESAQFMCEELLSIPLKIIGTEIQVDNVFMSEKSTPKGKGELRITTCIDALFTANDGGLIVYDWKTGYKKRTNEEARHSFQAQFIAYILWQQPEYQSVEKIHFFYKETRHRNNAYACFERNRTHKFLPDLTDELAFQARILETVKLMFSGCKDAWPMQKRCTWCEAMWFCEFADPVAFDIRSNLQDAIDQYIVISVRKKKLEEVFTELLQSGEMMEIKGTCTRIRRKQPTKPRFTLEVVPDGDPPSVEEVLTTSANVEKRKQRKPVKKKAETKPKPKPKKKGKTLL